MYYFTLVAGTVTELAVSAEIALSKSGYWFSVNNFKLNTIKTKLTCKI